MPIRSNIFGVNTGKIISWLMYDFWNRVSFKLKNDLCVFLLMYIFITSEGCLNGLHYQNAIKCATQSVNRWLGAKLLLLPYLI